MSFLEFIKMVFNRRVWFAVCALLIIIGPLLGATGTFNDIRVDRISFKTNPRYTYEVNTFFSNQTYGNLVQDYSISGYLFTPPLYYNLLSPNGKLPAIIFMHGMIASSEIQYNIPKALARAGFKVLEISQTGHGDTGGLWDMGIDMLAGVYSAVDYLKYMCWDVDSSKIGVAGHSMGGIMTTRAGIFDSWINPITGDPIGTNGSIRACGAIYCWSDMLDTVLYSASTLSSTISPFLTLLPDDIKNTLVITEPSINWLFTTWKWMGHNQPITLPYQMKARSVQNYINSTNIKNYELITGWDDELTNPLFQAYIMQNSTMDASGNPQVSAMEILQQVAGNLIWNYGNITNGTARRLVMIPGTDHIKEAYGDEVAYSLIDWFNRAMDTGWRGHFGEISYLDPAFFSDFALRIVGWIWLLIGSLGLIPVLASYLSSWLKNKENQQPKAALSFNKGQLIRRILMYSCIFIGFGVLGNFLYRYVFPISTFTRFWMVDLISNFSLFSALLQLPAILAIILYEWKRNGMSLGDFGLSPRSAVRGLAIGILAFLPTILIYNPLAYFTNLPMMLPRPFEIGVYVDFFVLMGIILLQSMVNELTFRGLIQTKLDKGERKLARWKTIFVGVLITGLVIGINFGLGVYTAFSSILNIPMVLLLIAVIGLAFGLISVLNGFLYQRTKSITTGILITAFLLSFLEAGKLFLIYA